MDNNTQKKGIAGYWLVTMFVAISFAIVFITAGILYFLQAPAQLESFEYTANVWTDRVVKVEAGTERSTGFVIEAKRENGVGYAYVVTTYHGVDDALESVKIRLNGELLSAENLRYNVYTDIAVFRVRCDVNYPLISAADVNIATEVMALGYPSGGPINAEMGVVNRTIHLDEHSTLAPLLCYDVSAYVQGGMSGCPIFTLDGKLVGMGARTRIDNIDGEQVHFSSDNYVVPASIIFAEYDLAKNHRSAKYINYYLSEKDGAIIADFLESKIKYDGKLTIDGKEIVKVKNTPVRDMIDFIASVITYSNCREVNGRYYVDVVTKDGETISIKVA
ncbi:MAG: trypsin-like peptidase domain-containing protein [Clostridia bacterium]|nr:trypsin-like peptidase domain-containing protein [Clostridia bacterium]